MSMNGDFSHFTELRRRIHSRPELGFQEHETAALVVAELRRLGLEPETGVGGTGVVATIRRGSGKGSIGLRADMDALPMRERNTFAHRSQFDDRCHACGHDGHVAMLLAAAQALSRSVAFDGTAHLIFQPAEEGLGGARAMIDDGLFERFPCDAIFSMHNMPRLPAGSFAMRSGPFFAASDSFRIVVRGRGGHAAMPHLAVDPIVAAAHIVTAAQSLISRNTDPLQAAVFTFGEFHGGTAGNVIPDHVELRGTARFLDAVLQETLATRFQQLVRDTAAALGATAETEYLRGFPVLVNAGAQTQLALRAAEAVAGADQVQRNAAPLMGSEDFAVLLQQVPGCCILIGNGGGADACMVHSPHYDFNDEIIPAGAAWWVRLVETALPGAGNC
jgi:amidohydrolase